MRRLSACLVVLLFASRLPAQVPSSLTDSAFGALSLALSEPSGFFDTDNLVSNEDSYLHAITTLRRLGISGGAYLGVGPDQNFSYIAAIRPSIAFIIDIRRDNLLELLLFQAIFAESRNRAEYVSLLFGKTAPADTAGWAGRDAEALFAHLERAALDSSRALARVRARVARLGIPLTASDLGTIGRFHRTFIGAGPALRLTSFNRPERRDYPDFRSLVLQADLGGRRASYLASEAAFRVVKSLADRNLIVPVVGDFGGDKALRATGRWIAGRGETVSAFYTSNVEQYLIQDRALGRFARNVAALPRGRNSVLVRSYFPYGRQHPQWVEGYLSVQIVQLVDRFLALDADRIGYYDLVTRDLVSPR